MPPLGRAGRAAAGPAPARRSEDVPHGHLARRLVPAVQLPLHRPALDVGEAKDMLDGTTPGCDVPCAHLAFAVAAPERGRALDPADYATGVEHVPARLTVVHDALKCNSGRLEHHHLGKDARPSSRKPPTRFPSPAWTAPKRSEDVDATTPTGPGTPGSHGSISDLRPLRKCGVGYNVGTRTASLRISWRRRLGRPGGGLCGLSGVLPSDLCRPGSGLSAWRGAAWSVVREA